MGATAITAIAAALFSLTGANNSKLGHLHNWDNRFMKQLSIVNKVSLSLDLSY